MHDLQEFQRLDKYARFNEAQGRRETWAETVTRAVDYLKDLSNYELDDMTYTQIWNGIYNYDVMPSMRLLAMAGPAAKRQNACIYNCSAIAIDSIDSFVEALILSMSGCGVGYSVEYQFTDKLPTVATDPAFELNLFSIDDTSEGWADALRAGLEAWFSGNDIIFNYDAIRPHGTRLKTKGGYASGPEPLERCLDGIRDIIVNRRGQKLRPIDCHDMMCLIGSCAVSGGTRRTAMLSLFDQDNEEMLNCKNGDYPMYRWNANNSAVWTDETTYDDIATQFATMHRGNNGEPGLFYRQAVQRNMPERRNNDYPFLTNPCGEITLRPQQLCNLSSVICRPADTIFSLVEKVRLATIIGTIQSMATYFPGLRPEWSENCKEERLLGVDLNGQLDCPVVQSAEVLTMLKNKAVKFNQEYATKLGVTASTSVTCVKPSGNASTFVNSAPGIHARNSPFYIRNTRVSVSSTLYPFLRDQNVPMDPENGQTAENADTYVIHWPIASPEEAKFEGRSAEEQLEYWLLVNENYAEHSVSCTISYTPEELPFVIQWVYDHKEDLSGLSFLPEQPKYDQLPYQTIDKETYETLLSQFPTIDWSVFPLYEGGVDSTTVSGEVSCFAGACLV